MQDLAEAKSYLSVQIAISWKRRKIMNEEKGVVTKEHNEIIEFYKLLSPTKEEDAIRSKEIEL